VEIPSKPEFMIRNQDDVGFMKNLAEKLKKQLRVDPSRLYVTGISDGGMMTHLLAAELPETFAAAAPIAGLSQLRASINAPLQTIGVSRAPIPMVIAQGTADKYVPYIGGKCANPDSNNLVGSFADTIRFWLDGNRATSSMPSSTELNAKKGYMLSIYDSGKAPVIAITVINGTHSWGKNGIMTSRDFSEIIWEQLSKFTKAKRTITPTDGGM